MVSWDTRMLSSSGYWFFSQPEICCGDQSRISYSQRGSATSGGWKEGSAWERGFWARRVFGQKAHLSDRLSLEELSFEGLVTPVCHLQNLCELSFSMEAI